MGRFSQLFFGEGYRNDAEPEAQPDGPAQPEVQVTVMPLLSAQGALAAYGSLMSVAYAACEQTKARSMASLPVTVMRKGAGSKGRDAAVAGHPLAQLLSTSPNEAMTAGDFMAWHRLRCDTFGTAFWRMEWYKGSPVAIWPVTCGVQEDFDLSRPAGRRLVYQLGGDEFNPPGKYFADEVIAVKTHINKRVTRGVSLAKLAAEEIGLSVDLERFYKSMLKNGNHHLGHVEVPEAIKNEKQAADLKAAVALKSGVENAGKAPIFSAGAKWVANQQTMRDASVIEQQKWVLHQICRACNVPPWKVYDGENVAYNGSQQANIDYVTDTVLPDARAIEQALTPVLRSMGDGDCVAKFNLKGLMRGDDAARAQYYRELTYMGAYTREQVAELEDIEPADGLDRPLFPLNYGTVNEDGTVTVYSSKRTPGDGSQAGVAD